jgi:hypothetical protein
MTTPWNEARIIAELLRDHIGPDTPATVAARRYLARIAAAAPAPDPDTLMRARIAELVRRATALQVGLVTDAAALDELWIAVQQLDADAGPGLAVGRMLHLDTGEGEAIYIIDRIDDDQVHVQWLPNHTGQWAHAVSSDGYVPRKLVEGWFARRDGRRG